MSQSLIQNGISKAQVNHNSSNQNLKLPIEQQLPPLSPFAENKAQANNIIGSARTLKHAFTVEDQSNSSSAFEGGNLSNSARKSRKSIIAN